MRPFDAVLWLACTLSALAWASLASARSRCGAPGGAARALVGGGLAFVLALVAYELVERAGVDLGWERVIRGGRGAVALVALIGLVEETAKLVGIVVATDARDRRRNGGVFAATVGVAAGFAALEAGLAVRGASPGVALARAALAPAAHAILSAPAAIALAAGARRGGRTWLWIAPALAASAALHGAGDLSLAAPRFGALGYFAALLAPALGTFVLARRLAPGVLGATRPSAGTPS